MLRKRLFALICAITFIFLSVLGRVFYVQIISGRELQEKAVDQWTRELPVKARRGVITDRNGLILAENKQSYAVFIRTRVVGDAERTAEKLSEILDVDKNALLKRINSDSSSEITVKRQVLREKTDAISKENLPGVYYCNDSERYYPYGESLAQIIGYSSLDGNGQSGLEKKYDEYLKGYDGEILYEADLVGRDVKGSAARYISATDGLNLKLTVDYEIQRISDSVISHAVTEYSPKAASIIVLSPANGQIIAVSQYPSFDLNDVPRENLSLLNKISR